MKKIDLHIHTVSSISDSDFTFDVNSLIEYVSKLEIDCIAITNHNLFDKKQYFDICNKLSIKVFPGIEIDLEGGHMLLISENENIDDFDYKCNKVQALIKTSNDSIDYQQLINIFPLLDKYLLIPHYGKNPSISENTYKKLKDHISTGEVSSLRKFKSCMKEKGRLVPVLFSDCRITTDMNNYSTKQIFVNAEEDSLSAIKGCLYDKTKVTLTKEDGNDFFQATDDGIVLSTGLNVIIGERSTGKTYTLDRISENFSNVKYVKQFALLQKNEESFKKLVTSKHSLISEEYLKEFHQVVLDINNVDLIKNDKCILAYIESLKKSAFESDKLDTFSKCKLYNGTKFEIDDLDNLKHVVKATETLIENTEYKSIINNHISKETLKALILELIKAHNNIYISNQKKYWVNELISNVRDSLKFRSTSTAISEIDFTKIQKDKYKVEKFINVVNSLKYEKEIDSKEIRGFKIIARTKKYTGASQLKAKSKSQLAFSSAFTNYSSPFDFLNSLKSVGIEESDFYKYFVDIEYNILNKYGFKVSGGERSEFNLLHEINDALKYDLLLIDEPESSFDNIFLKNEVNELLKGISKKIPVIIVTHNNTIGASIKPDHIIYTHKSINKGNVIYKVFYGHPTSKKLKNVLNEEIENLNILFNCLEAGESAYYERKTENYEILKN